MERDNVSSTAMVNAVMEMVETYTGSHNRSLRVQRSAIHICGKSKFLVVVPSTREWLGMNINAFVFRFRASAPKGCRPRGVEGSCEAAEEKSMPPSQEG